MRRAASAVVVAVTAVVTFPVTAVGKAVDVLRRLRVPVPGGSLIFLPDGCEIVDSAWLDEVGQAVSAVSYAELNSLPDASGKALAMAATLTGGEIA